MKKLPTTINPMPAQSSFTSRAFACVGPCTVSSAQTATSLAKSIALFLARLWDNNGPLVKSNFLVLPFLMFAVACHAASGSDTSVKSKFKIYRGAKAAICNHYRDALILQESTSGPGCRLVTTVSDRRLGTLKWEALPIAENIGDIRLIESMIFANFSKSKPAVGWNSDYINAVKNRTINPRLRRAMVTFSEGTKMELIAYVKVRSDPASCLASTEEPDSIGDFVFLRDEGSKSIYEIQSDTSRWIHDHDSLELFTSDTQYHAFTFDGRTYLAHSVIGFGGVYRIGIYAVHSDSANSTPGRTNFYASQACEIDVEPQR